MFKSMKNIRIFSRLALNIIIMLFFVLMVVSFISGMISSNALKKETDFSNTVFLSKLSKAFENELSHIDDILVRFLQSSVDVGNIADVIKDDYQRHYLYKKINELIQNNPYIDSISIYFDQGENVFFQTAKICSYMSTEDFFDKALYNNFTGSGKLSDILGARLLKPNYYGRESRDYENIHVLSFIKRLPINSIYAKNAVALNIDTNHMLYLIGGNYIPKGSTVLILDKSHNNFLSYSQTTGILANISSEDMVNIKSLVSGMKSRKEFFNTSFNAEKSYITGLTSVSGITYLIITPEDIIFKPIRTVNLTLFFLAALLLLIGIIISLLIDRKFFQPVLGILHNLKANQAEITGECDEDERNAITSNKRNEFKQIESYIDNMITKNRNQQKQLRSYFAYYKGKMLLALLGGDKQAIQMLEDDKILFNESFKWFNIVLLYSDREHCNLADKEKSGMTIDMIARNIIEILSRIGQVDIIDTGYRKLAFLICMENKAEPSEIADLMWKNATPELLNSKSIITVGCLCESMKNICDSYMDANRLIQYNSNRSGLQVIASGSLNNMDNTCCVYPEKISLQIIEKIIQQNKTAAKNDLKLFFEKLKQDGGGLERIKKCAIILLSSIRAETKDIYKNNKLALYNDILDDLDQLETVYEVELWMSRLLDNFIVDGIGKDEAVNNNELVDKVVKYINTHYMEELSLNLIADYVYFSPSYLGRVFKEISGFTFTDYLIKIRMEAAARLLLNKNVKVMIIMEKVGYSSLQSFSRVFKNYFNCSPSEYRKVHAWDILDANEKDEQII